MKNMFYKKCAHSLVVLGEICLLTAITLFAVFPISCKVTTSGIEIIGSDYTVPSLDGYSVESSEKLVLEFSEQVNLLSAIVSPANCEDSDTSDTIPIDIAYSEDNRTVTISFLSETNIGQSYKFYGEVENKKGSSLIFSVPFVGYNPRVPDLLLSEIHDGSTKIGGKEFIEFIALNDGNLAGLAVKSTNDGEASAFLFPALEVKKGDYITVHYRASGEDTSLCVSETTGDKTLSKAVGSSDTAWDLWADNTEARLGASQDIITLQNSNTGEILQAIVYNINKKSEWMKDKFQTAAEEVVSLGLWSPDAEIGNAFTFGTSAHIERTNVAEIIKSYDSGDLTYPFASNATEWIRVTDSKVTPGKPNNL